jgi:hypothetical protein
VPRPRPGSTECDCGAPIRWVLTVTRTPMPIDPLPHPDGNLVPVVLNGEKRARVLRQDELEAYQGDRWRSHFATCPNARTHRRPRKATR